MKPCLYFTYMLKQLLLAGIGSVCLYWQWDWCVCVCFRSRRRCDWCGCAGRTAVMELLSPEPKAVRWIRHFDSVPMFDTQETVGFVFFRWSAFFCPEQGSKTVTVGSCCQMITLLLWIRPCMGHVFSSGAVKLWQGDTNQLKQNSKEKKHAWHCLVKNNVWPFVKTANSY